MTTMNGSTSRIHAAGASVVRVNASSRNTLDRSGLAPIGINVTDVESSLTRCTFEMALSRNAMIRMQREGSLKGVDALETISAGGEDIRLVFEVEKGASRCTPDSSSCGDADCMVRMYLSDPKNCSSQHTIIQHELGCWLEQGQWLHVDIEGLLSATLRREGSSIDLVYLRTALLASMGFAGGRYEPVRSLARPALAGSAK